jgi:nicotinamidase-related amidase
MVLYSICKPLFIWFCRENAEYFHRSRKELASPHNIYISRTLSEPGLEMNPIGIIKRETTAFVMIDIQEKLVPVILGIDLLVANANLLVRASEILKVPLIVTEQYPKGLGHTTKRIQLPEKSRVIEKLCFSCFGSDEFIRRINQLKCNTIVLFGIEAHVCILKTALDALKLRLEVHVVADAISSRTPENKSIAVERMRQSGVFIASTEMIIFQLMEGAGTEEFKLLSKLIK